MSLQKVFCRLQKSEDRGQNSQHYFSAGQAAKLMCYDIRGLVLYPGFRFFAVTSWQVNYTIGQDLSGPAAYSSDGIAFP